MSFRSSILLLFLCPFGFLFVPTVHLHAQTTRRLILKDGSYQIVTKYEIQGDRVHYYSAERGEWEDVPDSLIDWEATNKYERDRAAGKMSPEAQALDREMEAERQQDEAESPHVAPGLRLPPEGGVYALDTYLSEPELLPLDQSNGEINRHVGRNVLRSAINPVAGSKRTIELHGPRANIQVHASLPTIYINLEPLDEENTSSAAQSDVTAKPSKPEATKPSADFSGDRFQIVRVQVKGDKRIVGAIKTAVLGKPRPQEDTIPATTDRFGQGWLKLTPKAPLQPGEYALVEMLGKEGMNSYVWDFGVHADAPANLAVIRPEKSKSGTTLPQPTSTLQQRK
jgi:hypothetical protein